MWQLTNETPFAVERGFVRDQNGAEVWLVAVKGTFDIGADGSTALAEDQVPVRLTPEYRGQPGASSLRYESDLVGPKPATDVIVHGHAYAPGGRPARSVDATLRVGPVSKTVRVFGDRDWTHSPLGVGTTEPEPFLRMPIIYERAFGGTDEISDDPQEHGRDDRNPIGVGFATRAEHLLDQPLPNIEDPHEPMDSWRQRPRPAGFGPIARDWSPRLEHAGTFDESWERERQPLLPADFDPRFYQCVPEDQQVPGYLRGGETIELHNLTPDGYLRFSLPRHELAFQTDLRRETAQHEAVLHTVVLEPDVPRAILVWHTHLPCHNREQRLRRTVIRQR